jgi:hypothetical protein
MCENAALPLAASSASELLGLDWASVVIPTLLYLCFDLLDQFLTASL